MVRFAQSGHYQRPLAKASRQVKSFQPRGIGAPLAVLFILSALILVSPIKSNWLDQTRAALLNFISPALNVLGHSIDVVKFIPQSVQDLFMVYEENQRLKQENADLKDWRDVSYQLKTQNEVLKSLLQFHGLSAHHYVTATVIADQSGSYHRGVVVNVGQDHGVVKNDLAFNGDGLVGRVTEVGDQASRVILLNDSLSRVPVRIERTGDKAILAGDQQSSPFLQYKKPNLMIGDRLVTTADGGVFPEGLPVGIIDRIEKGTYRIRLFAALDNLDYVKLIGFSAHTLDVVGTKQSY